METKLYIVTVATEQKYYMKYLLESIKKHNGELIILGYGEKWKGFNWRNSLMIDLLKKLNPNDVVCFIDAYDVLCLRNLNLMIEKFIEVTQREKSNIIVAYDNVQNYYESFIVQFYFGKCKNISLNAGTYIGYVKDVNKMISEIFAKNSDTYADDQILLTQYCNLNDKFIYIDIYNELFLTISDRLNDVTKYLTIEDGEIIYNNNKQM